MDTDGNDDPERRGGCAGGYENFELSTHSLLTGRCKSVLSVSWQAWRSMDYQWTV